MKNSLKHIAFLVCICISCNSVHDNVIIDASNPNIKLNNGVVYYNNIPFSGDLITHYQNKLLKSDIEYISGKKHGFEKHWNIDSDLVVERNYLKGKKAGIHRAWWNNGNLKFEYHFNEKGEYNGSVKEWYETGQLFKAFNYENGKEKGGQKLWYEDGRIKANYEVVNSERFGLIGLKKCYQVTVGSDEIK
nr:hypothetical protein [Gaetbulibacter sp. 4G1]